MNCFDVAKSAYLHPSTKCIAKPKAVSRSRRPPLPHLLVKFGPASSAGLSFFTSTHLGLDKGFPAGTQQGCDASSHNVLARRAHLHTLLLAHGITLGFYKKGTFNHMYTIQIKFTLASEA